jgi:hypothetical protein
MTDDTFTLNAADVFDRGALARICSMREDRFEAAFDFDRYEVAQPVPDDFFLFRDNGGSVLAVAHLDTVAYGDERAARFVKTEGGEVVFSRALDDRLGAYIILDMLPKLGINVDILLTVGEESGRSTAAFFDMPAGKNYDWMIEFDRGGTDVVMYQYEDSKTIGLVKECGARVGDGIFSDISYLDHLEIKGFNWGVGYQDYHGPRAHAFLDDTFRMVDYFQVFYALNVGTRLPHYDIPTQRGVSWPPSRYGAHYSFDEPRDRDAELAAMADAVLDENVLDEYGDPALLHGSTDPFYWEDDIMMSGLTNRQRQAYLSALDR